SWAAGAICARTRSRGCIAMSASTGSGRVPRRSSAWSSAVRSRSGALGFTQLGECVNADQTFIAPESSGHIDVAGGRVWYRSNGDRHRARSPLLVIHGGPGAPHDYLLPLLAMSGERRVVF